METLNPQAVDQHKSIQAAEAAQLMYDLLVDPQVNFIWLPPWFLRRC